MSDSLKVTAAAPTGFGQMMKIPAIVIAAAAAYAASGTGLAQTTRTSPSANSTFKSLPSSSSTSPNSPCNPNNPTSPCFSANAPRSPCYSAASPNEPCSTTTTPPSYAPPQAPAAPEPARAGSKSAVGSALTVDQAKSRIEEAGYSSVSGLRKEAKGAWRASAVKDGQAVTVLLDGAGKVSEK
jgi:hypothetical protein